MKNLFNLGKLFLLGALLTGIVSSCDQDEVNPEAMNEDAQLIEAIQNASNKSAVNTGDLPSVSQATLASDYTESFTENAVLAENLGYEVSRRSHKGDGVGERYYAYFNLEGRELMAETGEGVNNQNQNRHQHQHRFGLKPQKCFDFVLPVSFTMPDSSEISITSEEDWLLIKEWYEAYPDTETRPEVQYPATILFRDGTSLTLESEDDLSSAKELCAEQVINHVQMHKCFQFVLPVSFLLPDETTLTITTKSDWKNLKEWCKENPDTELKPMLQFPVEIIFSDSTTLTIENIEELDDIREVCKEQRKENSLFERNIISPIVYVDECDYPVSGTVEIIFEDEVVAVIDYGDGTCDNLATITTNGETTEFEMNGKRWQRN